MHPNGFLLLNSFYNQLQGVPPHFRGHVKTKAKALVEKHYKFKKGIGHEEENKAIYAQLKSSKYAYVNAVTFLLLLHPTTLISIFKSDKVDFGHDIVRELLFESMFRSRTDIGVKFSNYFNPGNDELLPDTTIAFLVTTVSGLQVVIYSYMKAFSDRVLPGFVELGLRRY
jgi:hypothetical protein